MFPDRFFCSETHFHYSRTRSRQHYGVKTHFCFSANVFCLSAKYHLCDRCFSLTAMHMCTFLETRVCAYIEGKILKCLLQTKKTWGLPWFVWKTENYWYSTNKTRGEISGLTKMNVTIPVIFQSKCYRLKQSIPAHARKQPLFLLCSWADEAA